MEREANQFAAELLMPAAACRALVERFWPTFGRRADVLTRRMANEFLVSQAAMKRRLFNLGLAGGGAD
jgi:Zn-dependent peptidase ImmA (M78 family)